MNRVTNTILLVAAVLITFRSTNADTVVLTWTATGDDRRIGTAASYDLRYSTSTITTSNWAQATQVQGEPSPKLAGLLEEFIVSGLDQGRRYYFAIRAIDDKGNISALSNVVSKVACQQGCSGIRGNIDGDSNETIEIGDLLYFVNYMFNFPGSPEPHCRKEADVDASGGVDVADLIYLVNYMFTVPPGEQPKPCS